MVSFQWASYYLFKIFPQHNLLFFLTYHKLIFNIIITCHMTRGCCRVVAQLGTMPTPASVWVSVSEWSNRRRFNSIFLNLLLFLLPKIVPCRGQAKGLWLFWRVYASWRWIWGRATGQTLAWCCLTLCYLWWPINGTC